MRKIQDVTRNNNMIFGILVPLVAELGLICQF